jgi:hypothetical protein
VSELALHDGDLPARLDDDDIHASRMELELSHCDGWTYARKKVGGVNE